MGLFAGIGCAIHDFSSPLTSAETLHTQAYHENHETQMILFQESCRHYLNAYQADFRLFDMTKIRDAIHACSSAHNFQAVDAFRGFLKRYRERYPGEIKWSQPLWIKQHPGAAVSKHKAHVRVR